MVLIRIELYDIKDSYKRKDGNMDNEKYFWEMWNLKGKMTLKVFNKMLESKKFEHMSLMSWRYNKTGYHLIRVYKRYKKYVLTSSENYNHTEDRNEKDEISDIEKFVAKIKKENPEVVEWLNKLGDE